VGGRRRGQGGGARISRGGGGTITGSFKKRGATKSIRGWAKTTTNGNPRTEEISPAPSGNGGVLLGGPGHPGGGVGGKKNGAPPVRTQKYAAMPSPGSRSADSES